MDSSISKSLTIDGNASRGGDTPPVPIRVCIVSSCGGHLAEVRALSPAFEQMDYFFVLNDVARLPQEIARRTQYVRHSERDWLLLVNFFEAWLILRRERPDVILSTGAGPAVPFAAVGKLLRIPNVFIETVTRTQTPSLTGRLMYHLADKFFYQWPALARYFPKGTYGGSLL